MINKSLFLFLDVESAIQSKMFKEGNIWYCNDCPYKSNRKSNLLEHVEARHVSHPGYLCQYCEKVFGCESSPISRNVRSSVSQLVSALVR